MASANRMDHIHPKIMGASTNCSTPSRKVGKWQLLVACPGRIWKYFSDDSIVPEPDTNMFMGMTMMCQGDRNLCTVDPSIIAKSL